MAMKADLLSPPTNFAIVQLPERQFPGVVVQGDSLYIMRQRLAKMGRLLAAGELGELTDEIEDMKEQLTGVLAHYERVCAERGIKLPYLRPVGKGEEP